MGRQSWLGQLGPLLAGSLFIGILGTGPALEASAPTAALAVAPVSPTANPNHYGGVLDREIARQAFLLAAREEMGLPIRDELLGDAPNPAAPALEIETILLPGEGKSIRIRRQEEAGKVDVWEKSYLFNDQKDGRSPWLSLMEAESRRTFPGILKKAGLAAGTRPAGDGGEAVPDSTAKRLDEMSIASQFAALRELHELSRTSQSPAIQGALIRAYANLSLLTEHQLSPSYNVFKARALLYAERLVVADPKSPWGRWHRAYARCLGGMHALAEEDLAGADELLKKAPKGGGPSGTKPAWVPLIAASCRFDPAPLADTSKDPHLGELALLLRFIAVENPGATELMLQAGRDVIEARPEAFRVLDGMCYLGGVGDQRTFTELALATSQRSLREGLSGMPGMPPAVKTPLEGDDDKALLDALDGADGGEPSWASYAHLYREERFAEACRRLYFLRHALGVPTNEVLGEMLPEFKEHPYGPYLLLFSEARNVALAGVAPLVAAMKAHALQLDLCNHIQMTRDIAAYDRVEAGKLHQWALHGGDAVYRDLVVQMGTMIPLNKTSVSGVVSRLSPHAPAAIVEDINKLADDAEARTSARKWEEEYAAQPAVLAALGRRYASWKDMKDCERLFKAAIALSPDSRMFLDLAAAYRGAGDIDGWKRTLDDYLARGEDSGLGHAQARVSLARYFMDRGRWAEAQPYAEAAAASYAQWAMECAVECYEGLNDWEHAEIWVAREAQRYNRPVVWYFWCLRTGHGHVKEAQAAIWARIEQNQEGLFVVAEVLEVDGRKREAFEFYQREYAARGVVAEGISFVALADDLGEDAARDKGLAAMAAKADAPGKKPTQEGQRARFAAMLQASIARGDDAVFAPEELERLVDTSAPELRPVFRYYAGRFVEKRGHADEALALYKRALEPPGDPVTSTHATLDIRRLSPPDKPAPKKPATAPRAKKKKAA